MVLLRFIYFSDGKINSEKVVATTSQLTKELKPRAANPKSQGTPKKIRQANPTEKTSDSMDDFATYVLISFDI